MFICIITSDVVIFSVEASNQNNKETNSSNIQTNSQDYEQDYIRIFKDIGIPIITLSAGIISAKYIVGGWQKRKEISDLRKEILSDYTITFKNYVILMDTFVLKLVLPLFKIDNQNSLHKPRLSSLIPYEYTYEDLLKYAKKVREDEHLHFGEELIPEDEKQYKNEKIAQELEELYKENHNCYIDFSSEALNQFRKNNEPAFQERFYNTKDIVAGFSGRLSQYYKDSGILLDEFSMMWEYMMGCYILVNKTLKSENEKEFFDSLRKYNKSSRFLFDMMINFEKKLISQKIVIERSNILNRLCRNHHS